MLPHQNKAAALASGHGRYMAVSTERKISSVGGWPLNKAAIKFTTHPLLNSKTASQRPAGDRFTSTTSETATWIKKSKNPLGPLGSSIHNVFVVAYRNMPVG
jgi:hypothetical protein